MVAGKGPPANPCGRRDKGCISLGCFAHYNAARQVATNNRAAAIANVSFGRGERLMTADGCRPLLRR